MTIVPGDAGPHAVPSRPVPSPAADTPAGSAARHPSAVGGRLDTYLDGVVAALHDRGVRTGAPERTDAADRLVGSVVLDCSAVRTAGPRVPPVGGAVGPGQPTPVAAVWDEQEGWSVRLDDGSGPRHLRPDLLPDAGVVADFVVGLALGRCRGADHPVGPPVPGRPHLRLVR
ncbi:hypothetical protein GCM10017691_25620 [Pseudonocardia petroleophila]|uniref:Uncharacterized protein n=1 Tax=Pseudonocardia petroleophila TaxID=37331 RepID=A0A7G7MFF4_9PSEU|nr:hypothetical protein [Pseudonocardia petroleophila]QNG51515.1 hypothetical protein H6H00_25915 [Pseudonocardia petroleophila]